MVFVAFCPRHDCEVLLGAGCLRGLTHLAPGVLALELECYDGEPLVVLTGSHVGQPADVRTRR